MPTSLSPILLKQQFFARFTGRHILAHAGFPPGYLAELLKQPGGAGYFRVDLRIPHSNPPSPLEWVIHQQLGALELPVPYFVQVSEDSLYVRHLVQGEGPGHPSEILWMRDSLGDRYHYLLRSQGPTFQVVPGMPLDDNRIDYDFFNES
ncbi:MAG: hypothetical protein K0041_07190 [Acidithiobacillus sp.]|nr:hypothetical protein [Acidithiobacillus sp.]